MFINMPDALRDLALWDQQTPQQGAQLAQFVESHLPAAWRFSHLAFYEVGTQKRQVALFHWQPDPEQASVLFSLIPGAVATLGFDRAHPVPVPKELVLDWQEFILQSPKDQIDRAVAEILAQEPDIAHDELFYDYLAEMLHPLRTVTIHPLLVEVVEKEASTVLPPPRYTYWYIYDQKSRKRRKVLHRGKHVTIPHRQVVAFLRHQGFRLLTADEWEYVCAAGSRELFYWWNEECDIQGNASSWEEVRNAFGLAIARDAINLDTDYDYQWEYCADPTIMKGDGGCLVGCGYTAYLTFASAYYQKLSEKWVTLGVCSPQIRRVFDLMGAARTDEINLSR